MGCQVIIKILQMIFSCCQMLQLIIFSVFWDLFHQTLLPFLRFCVSFKYVWKERSPKVQSWRVYREDRELLEILFHGRWLSSFRMTTSPNCQEPELSGSPLILI